MLSIARPLNCWGLLGNPTEIMFTGGEPQLLPNLGNYIDAARMMFPESKLYLYTTMTRPTTQELLERLDGVQFTLHAAANAKDKDDFHEIQDDILNVKDLNPAFSSRLVIIKGVSAYLDLDTSAWDSVRLMPWIPNCPLPSDEQLWRVA